MTKAILIDPFDRTVTMIEKEDGLKPIYDALTEPVVHVVRTVDAIRLGPKHFAYVDDEGFLAKDVPTFTFLGADTPLAGKALLVGSDDEGDDADIDLSVEQVAAKVVWLDLVSTGDISPGRMVTPPENADFVYMGGKPIMKDKDE